MRLTFQKPQWDHTVTGRKGRASGKGAGALERGRMTRDTGPPAKRTSGARNGPAEAMGAGGDPEFHQVAANSRAAARFSCNVVQNWAQGVVGRNRNPTARRKSCYTRYPPTNDTPLP